MHFVRRAVVVACVVFAGCLVGYALQRLFPTQHLADAKSAITTIQGRVTLLLAGVLGLLVWTSYGVYSQQRSEPQTLGSQILQLDLALERCGSEADRGRELLKKELIATRERFWGEDGAGPALMTYAQSRAELHSMDGFFAALRPATDEQRRTLDKARQLSESIVETHYLMSRQLSDAIPHSLLVSVVCWATLVFTCAGALSAFNALALLYEALGAASVSSAIYLILEFSQPYAGLFNIPSDGIDQVIAALSAKAAHSD
ncbi:MAG TPA: hypothetical protein VJY34_16835 [Roseiarcus sp.]|nr:hypothetical protein [Roseiarcus sp.]